MQSENLIIELREKTTLGNNVYFKDKNTRRRSLVGKVIDEVSIFEEADCYKHFVQKIEYTPECQTVVGTSWGYRIGYYTIDAKKTRIVWGQYASQMPEKMFLSLITEAYKKFILHK